MKKSDTEMYSEIVNSKVTDDKRSPLAATTKELDMLERSGIP